MGAISSIFFSFNGDGPKFWTGETDVKSTTDCPVMPSISILAFAAITQSNIVRNLVNSIFIVWLYNLPIAKFRSRRRTKPTKYWLSLDTTTGYPLCSVSFSKLTISSTVMESCVITDNVSFRLKWNQIIRRILLDHPDYCWNAHYTRNILTLVAWHQQLKWYEQIRLCLRMGIRLTQCVHHKFPEMK